MELSVAVVIIISLFPLVPYRVSAAGENVSLTTSPVSEVLNSKPGSVITTTLHVQNNSSLPLPMSIKLYTFG
ncbi:MAG: hypothetical protein ABSD13_20830, partial [Candidatus Korobacteraceae bacterium]